MTQTLRQRAEDAIVESSAGRAATMASTREQGLIRELLVEIDRLERARAEAEGRRLVRDNRSNFDLREMDD